MKNVIIFDNYVNTLSFPYTYLSYLIRIFERIVIEYKNILKIYKN